MSSEATRVYVQHDGVAWVEATISKQSQAPPKQVEVVIDADDQEESNLHPDQGTRCLVPKDDILLQNANVGVNGCEDMVSLNYLHEPAILYNLKQRFTRKLPYTYTGPICIAVNPYTWLDIYNRQIQEQYLEQDRSELPPHVYATSAASYQHMRMFGEDQSILVSGESGAGKTETTKILMSHLAAAGSEVQGANRQSLGLQDDGFALDKEHEIVERVLGANPLMESFGNAKTCRNDNSSRFGKFCELQFNALGQLIGAKSRTYLLEKSRVSTQGVGERNYHIFYQLLSGPEDLQESIKLKGMKQEDFPYLTVTVESKTPTKGKAPASVEPESPPVDLNAGMRDAERLVETRACLKTLGVAEATETSIFKIVAAVLHLSRLQFAQPDADDDDKSCLDPADTNQATIKTVCELLQLESAEFEKSLTSRVMSLSKSETYQVPLNVQQAQQARTALAVALYSRLFSWLIKHVNYTTDASHAHPHHQPGTIKSKDKTRVAHKIGILDIFGFEIFEKNSFEQLCINYANEKLQQKFTQDVFKTIQNEYEEEGIPWTKIEFQDNVQVLALVEGRFGILSLLNEECMRPKGSDDAFSNKLKAHYSDHERFAVNRLVKENFVVFHYAGKVEYDTRGFLLKNTDALQQDLMTLMKSSQFGFVAKLFEEEQKQNDSFDSFGNDARSSLSGGMTPRFSGGMKRRGTSILSDTVGTQFKSQLNALMEDIRRTNVHYVRCIKPNNSKSATKFHKLRVTQQLQCAGVVEAVRISRCAFPNRMLQRVFLERFRCLASADAKFIKPADDTSLSDKEEQDMIKANCDMLLTKELLPGQESVYQMGKTRIFFRKGALEGLEEKRSNRFNSAALLLQRYARKWHVQAQFRQVRRACVQLQAMMRMWQMRNRFNKNREIAMLVQRLWRGLCARRLLERMKQTHAANKIQAFCRMTVARVKYAKILASILLIQSVLRMSLAKKSFVVLQKQAKEDAKLENQIQLLKMRLAQEKQARLELEAQAGRTSFIVRNEEALTGADEVIDRLRNENAALKEANSNLKSFNAQLRKEKEVMERGAYVNGASFAAANQRAIKLQEEVEVLKSAHARIKNTHRVLKAQNLASLEQIQMMQKEMMAVVDERNAFEAELDEMHQRVDTLQMENASLAKANARLRLILRQEPELSRKHRDEVPFLTKLAYKAPSPIHTGTSSRSKQRGSSPGGALRRSVSPKPRASPGGASKLIGSPILIGAMTVSSSAISGAKQQPEKGSLVVTTQADGSKSIKVNTSAALQPPSGSVTTTSAAPLPTMSNMLLRSSSLKKNLDASVKTQRVVNVLNLEDNAGASTPPPPPPSDGSASEQKVRQPNVDSSESIQHLGKGKDMLEEDTSRVSFRVTMKVDPAEEVQKAAAAASASKNKGGRSKPSRRGSYDRLSLTGADDPGCHSGRSSLTGHPSSSATGSSASKASKGRRGSYDRFEKPPAQNERRNRQGAGGKVIEL